MQNHNHLSDEEKKNRPLVDWSGLSNEPRNENLAKIRDLGSFEKKENAREMENEKCLSYGTAKIKSRDPWK